MAISILSNPAKEFLILKTIAKIGEDLYYSILDIKGHEIISNTKIKEVGQLIKISVASLQRGIYLLRVVNKEGFEIQSFVKI